MFRPLLLILVPLIITLVPLEIGARVYQKFVRHQTIEDSIFTPCYRHYFFLGPGFNPNARCDWQAIPGIEVNSLGFRGPEFPIEKPKGTFRIIAFGGSTSHAGNYPAKLAELMKPADVPGYDSVEVINAAVPTWNTTQSLVQFITRAAYLKPDLILIFHAINDSPMTDHYWLRKLPEVDYPSYGGFLMNHSQLFVYLSNRWDRAKAAWDFWRYRRQVAAGETAAKSPSAEKPASTQVFETDISHFIALAKFDHARVALITMPLNYDPKQDAKTNAERAGPAYADYSYFSSRVSQFNEVARQLAKKHGVQLIDAAKSPIEGDPASFVDLCHFNETGARKFAELVRAELRKQEARN